MAVDIWSPGLDLTVAIVAKVPSATNIFDWEKILATINANAVTFMYNYLHNLWQKLSVI